MDTGEGTPRYRRVSAPTTGLKSEAFGRPCQDPGPSAFHSLHPPDRVFHQGTVKGKGGGVCLPFTPGIWAPATGYPILYITCSKSRLLGQSVNLPSRTVCVCLHVRVKSEHVRVINCSTMFTPTSTDTVVQFCFICLLIINNFLS